MLSLVVLSSLLVVSLFFINFLRSKNKKNFQLINNCLLSTSPILFLSGPQSIFYFWNYWNHIPNYLEQHGYHTLNFSPGAKSLNQRLENIHSYLTNLSQKVHLMADQSSVDEALILREKHPSLLKSINIFCSTNNKTKIQDYILQNRGNQLPTISINNPEYVIESTVWVKLVCYLHNQCTNSKFKLVPSNIHWQSIPNEDLNPGLLCFYLKYTNKIAEQEFCNLSYEYETV